MRVGKVFRHSISLVFAYIVSVAIVNPWVYASVVNVSICNPARTASIFVALLLARIDSGINKSRMK